MSLMLLALLAWGLSSAEAAKKSYRYEDDPIRLGMKALGEGRLADARKMFEEAVANEHQVYRAHFGLGEILVREGTYENAEPLYRVALIEKAQETGSPDYPEAHASLGLVLFRLGRTAEAQTEFEQALREKGNLWEAQYGLARIAIEEKDYSAALKYLEKGAKRKGFDERQDLYCYGMALLQVAQDDLQGAEKNALKAFNIYPNDPEYGTLVGEIFTRRGAPTLAIKAYEDALNTPGLLATAPVHHALGRLYQKETRYDEAKNEYLEAVRQDSTYAPALKDLADLYFLAKRYDDSANRYLQYTQLRKSDPAGFLGFAESALNMRKYYLQAFEAAQQAFKIDSTDVRTRLVLARSAYQAREKDVAARTYATIHDSTRFEANDYVSLGQLKADAKQFDAAQQDFTHAVEIDSTLSDAWFALGMLDLGQGKPDSAAIHFQKTVDLAPANTGAWVNLGVALMQQRKNIEAISPLREAIRLAPDFLPSHLYLANALVNADSLGGALTEYRWVKEKDPQNVSAMRGLAFCYLKRGDYGQAVGVMREATNIEGGNADNWMMLGRALVGNGNNEGAIRAFEKVAEINPNHADAKNALKILKGTQ